MKRKKKDEKPNQRVIFWYWQYDILMKYILFFWLLFDEEKESIKSSREFSSPTKKKEKLFKIKSYSNNIKDIFKQQNDFFSSNLVWESSAS